jgi:hypothetical protein
MGLQRVLVCVLGKWVIVSPAFFPLGIFVSFLQGMTGSAVSALLPALSNGRRSRVRGAGDSVHVDGEEASLRG